MVAEFRVMNADDLDRQWRLYEGVTPDVVDRLIEHGHLDTVVATARSGEWFSAAGAVKELAARRDWKSAWEVLAPFAETGWWHAIKVAADLLERQGRVDEAIGLVRAQAEGGERLAWSALARLLARHGRVDEAIEVLRPHLEDWLLLEAVAEATEGHGRDEEVTELLRPAVEDKLRTGEPWNAVILMGRVLERQGRVDEALGLLRRSNEADQYSFANEVEEFTAMLARHDRLEALRELAAEPDGGYAASALADRLAQRGRIDEGIAILRGAPGKWLSKVVHDLVRLLAESGRVDEIVEAARPEMEGRDCGCLLTEVVDVLAANGRAGEAFDLIAEMARHHERDENLQDFLNHQRLMLLAESGRLDEAIAEASTPAEDPYGFRADSLARLLEKAGRADEAIAVLIESGHNPSYAAGLLIERGRVEEAVAICRRPSATPAIAPSATDERYDECPF
ncbi:tetratricopeptide repeat protein [Nonomuraea sp. FMUSA5-5]|uniref:Tetratricopeptide repeat protein n=2 Tax=Nonomuraea composti TaxID=2720023 RepID=A0ABX1BP04_9ACTN|nr:tetratricopeptide repeat protein [Nonomuraea sp. FMUSA5-5]